MIDILELRALIQRTLSLSDVEEEDFQGGRSKNAIQMNATRTT